MAVGDCACSQAIQEDIDGAVLVLLSYLSHLGEVITVPIRAPCFRSVTRMSLTQPSLRRRRSSP